jgi:hypothetical protein
MRSFLLLIFIYCFCCCQTQSQSGIKLNRPLFNMLPSEVPDSINFTDQNGIKQGWWIYYSIKYCPSDIPDQQSKGDFVPEYTYGKYKNGRKIGNWKRISNLHLIYPISEEDYEYYGDTVRITSWSPKSTIVVVHNQDSTLLMSEILVTKEKYSIIIKCSKLKGQCEMTYRGKLIKSFSISDFEIEQEAASLMVYQRKMRLIDRDLK